MESEIARRRLKVIASHFVSTDDLSSQPHLLPMNCSSCLNSAIPRYDNRMQFARQGSATQGFFMRPAAPPEQKTSQVPSSPRNGTAVKAPLFSRPSKEEQLLPDNGVFQSEGPKFSRPASRDTRFRNKSCSSESRGNDWSPRMVVVESGRGYALRIEVPGVNVNDIRVEVSNNNLRVLGKRSNSYSITSCSTYSVAAHRKREIFQEPFQVVWPLPSNANKDNVSAELMDGILKIVVPKL